VEFKALALKKLKKLKKHEENRPLSDFAPTDTYQ